MNKVNLGDGVYVQWDGFHLILTTWDGYEEKARIVLEPKLLDQIIQYVEKVQQEKKEVKLQEAADSGRRIKRKNDQHWVNVIQTSPGFHAYENKYIYIEDALASDWEVEPLPDEKIEITRDQLVNVWNNNFDQSMGIDHVFNKMIKELGFKS